MKPKCRSLICTPPFLPHHTQYHFLHFPFVILNVFGIQCSPNQNGNLLLLLMNQHTTTPRPHNSEESEAVLAGALLLYRKIPYETLVYI